MKFKWYQRLICYVFIAILFASGMHVEIDNSHSFLACETKGTTENSCYSNSQTYISSDYCTPEILQPRNNQYIKSNSNKTSSIRRVRSISLGSTICSIKHSFFYLEEHYISNILSSDSSQEVIIEYIHRQDGAK